MTIQAHATEITQGNYVSFQSDGERKRIEVVRLIRDIGCVHLWTYGPRVVTLPNDYPVVTKR